MGRPRSEDAKSGQLNVRLTVDQVRALEVIAFLDGGSPPETVRALIEREIARRRQDPLFIEGLRLKAAAESRTRGELAVLPRADDVS